MSVRHFWLRNAVGSTVDLMSRSLFLYKPTGLGYTRSMTFQRVAEGFFATSLNRLGQSAMAGEIVFAGSDPYSEYAELMDWIATAGSLQLGYSPSGDSENTFWAAAQIDAVAKAERTVGSGVLRVPVSVRLTGLWSRITPIVAEIAPTASPLTYPQTYPRVYGTAIAGSYSFTAGGHEPAAFGVVCEGALTNPVLSLVRDDTSTTIGVMALTATVASGATLVYSSVPLSDGVWVQSSAGTLTDMVSSLDLTKNNFFRAPVGIPCTITLTADDTISTTAMLSIYEFFVSV